MRLPTLLLVALVFTTPLHAKNEVGFVEKFALAKDREAVLQQLVPGTEEHYFFHALHYQNARQAAKLTTILQQWAKRFPESPTRTIIENREALLAYDANPQQTLQFLRERLGLEFHHVPEVRDQKPDLPASLDPQKIAQARYLEEALRHDDLGPCEEQALEQIVRDRIAISPAQRRALLARLTRPDVPGLVEVIAQNLKERENYPFGEFAVQKALLPAQLDALAKLVPRITDDTDFVYTRLRKLAPSADEDPEFDPAAREAWLERQWAYVKTLPASFNSLKAHILYARLDHDRQRGVYDEARFREYLSLPRQANYINPKYLETPRNQGVVADLNAHFEQAGLRHPPIGSDEALVRDYFLHIFAKAPSWEPWSALIRDTWLKPVFAEARIVHGVGNPEEWASLLSPAAFQALKERVDIEFPATNPKSLAPADEVTFAVTIKNTPKLIVKIYEINTLSFFLTQGRELNTDLNLDGLVANQEETHEGDASPFRRVTRSFSFPALKGQRGAWVIEFIGGGKSSRALIRKGQLKLLTQSGPAGDLLTVLDETNKPLQQAAVWVDGRKYSPAPPRDGQAPDPRILVPFASEPTRKQAVLATADGTFAALASFEHGAEKFQLDAQFHIEREQLLARRDGTLGIRTQLLVNDASLSPELLQDAQLTLTATTIDGIPTKTTTKNLKLSAEREFIHRFSVPDRLVTLHAQLTAKVESLTRGGEKQTLSAEKTWEINGIDRTAATNDGHLSKFSDDYVFELLGKNGEPIADQQVVFEVRHQAFTQTIQLALRTDDQGRIALGALKEIESIHFTAPNERKGSWVLESFRRTWPTVLHLKAGEKLAALWTAGLPPANVSLLEVRGGEFVADRTEAGFKNALPAGDYSLRVREENGNQHVVTVRVAAGERVQNWLVAPHRTLEVRETAPLHIETVQAVGNGLNIRLANTNAFTRVHVAATRFIPTQGMFAGLAGFARFAPSWGTPDKLPNLYSSGRAIGDEYRYIIERRYTQRYPGNMLTRPGLLLNPWEKRVTGEEELAVQQGQAAGSTRGARSGGAPAAPEPMAAAIMPKPEGTEDTNLDFLATAAPVLWNLTPDKDGVIVVPRAQLGDRQHVQIYAEDLTNAVWTTASFPEVPTKFTDLRLTQNLDPAKAFTQRKQTKVLTAGQTLKIDDLRTSEFETYDTLGAVHSLLLTLTQDPKLVEFAWVLEWPKLKEEEKRAKYSANACHELHLFLARKDPAFFEEVVQPYLRNKKEKTFLDDYLLANDLQPYLEPWRFSRLNVMERALLAARLPAESKMIARHLKELWEMQPLDPERQAQWFETALHGRFLDIVAQTLDPTRLAVNGRMGELMDFSPPELAVKEGVANHLDAPAPARPALGVTGRMARGEKDSAAADEDRFAGEDQLVKRKQSDRREIERKSMKSLAEKSVEEMGLTQDEALAGVVDSKNFYSYQRLQTMRERARQQAYYRRLGPTKEWAENNYYKLPIDQQNAELITINTFWRDFAEWVAEGSKAPFLSPHVAEASRNFSEMMCALAVLDLPFEASKHTTQKEGPAFTLVAASPIIVFYQEITPAEVPDAKEPGQTAGGLLISENFFREGDRYRHEGNEKFDQFVTGEFLAGVVYGAQLVVTNPNSAPVKLDLLTQIPRGALPVKGSKATQSRAIRLEPYTTQQLTYFFYFPLPGEAAFPHFPVNATIDGKVAAAGKATTFNVVRKLSEIDKASWDYVSQNGTDAEVFHFLEQANLQRIDLERIAWRARASVEFFQKLVALLEKRHIWSEPIYRYAVQHNDLNALRTWLRHRDDFIAQLGPWLNTKLLTIDPIERRAYEHLEYSPLVNQRSHRLGSEHRIANDALLTQYRSLLDILSYKPTLDALDAMSVTYYLLLQGRVEEGLSRFQTVSVEALPTRLQHDYFRCYAAFYEEKLADARTIAANYAQYPVDRWRALFAEVTAQLNEIEGEAGKSEEAKKEDRAKQQAALAQTQPSFDFKVENRTISLTWRNLQEVTVNYYLMDPEFLFSSSPFVSADPARFAIIKPTKSTQVPLPADKDALDVPLPAEFAKSNVLIEVLGAGQRKAQPYHANSLKFTVAEQYGHLEAHESATDKAVSKAYVKVYARLKNGTVRFYKDGYTDLRGKFDYASLNSGGDSAPMPPPRPMPLGSADSGSLDSQMIMPAELDQVARLSILLMSEAHGAATREVAPPTQ